MTSRIRFGYLSLLISACSAYSPNDEVASAVAEARATRSAATAATAAAPVQALFDLTSRTTCPFPSDRFTVPDSGQNTGLRVALPKPDCASRPSDCVDIDALNQLDGFNITPRMSIAFSGDLDLSTVTSDNIFLLRLGSALPDAQPGSAMIGINQIVWDVATRTLHVKTDEQLDQATRYALFVTSGVHAADGTPIRSDVFDRFRHDLNYGQTGVPNLPAYRTQLIAAIDAYESRVAKPKEVIVASVFTTLSVTTELEKIRDQLKAATPPPATFDLAGRTVFDLASVGDIAYRTQTSTSLLAAPVSFAALLKYRAGAIATAR
jgi:hypothetical protein